MIKNPNALQFLSYIKSLSSPWVFKYFLKNTNSKRKILSTNIIEKAVSAFVDPQNLKSQFEGLDSDEKLSCALIYLTGDAGLNCDIEDPLEHPLVKSFLVFAATDQSGNTKLFGFEEFAKILRPGCVATISECAQSEKTFNTLPQWKWRPLNDITIVIALASQGEIKKGRNGKFARTTLQKIKRLSENLSKNTSEGGDYIPRMMVAYCLSKDILHEYEMKYSFNQEAFKIWRQIPLDERLEDCKKFVITYGGSWRTDIITELLTTSESTTIDLKIFPEQDRASAIESIRALRFAGVLEYKCIDECILVKAVTRLETADEINNSALIQADFSAVIPEETDPGVLYSFAQIGELSSLDKVYKGKVEKNIIGNSLSRGISSDDMLDWLLAWQAPSNVVETIREWIREFFRLYISGKSVLVSGDEKVSRQLESYEPLRSHLEIINAHTIYQVKHGSEAHVKEILDNLGFDYRKPGERKTENKDTENPEQNALISFEHWKPVVEGRSEVKKKSGAIRGTKYGEELKALDMSEIVHVIDYAVLVGRNLTVDYEGSPYLKPGIYTILPLSCRKGIEPVLEAEIVKTKSRKQFYIKKIKRIGVTAE